MNILEVKCISKSSSPPPELYTSRLVGRFRIDSHITGTVQLVCIIIITENK